MRTIVDSLNFIEKRAESWVGFVRGKRKEEGRGFRKEMWAAETLRSNLIRPFGYFSMPPLAHRRQLSADAVPQQLARDQDYGHVCSASAGVGGVP